MIDTGTVEYLGHAVFWWVMGAFTAWVYAKARERGRKADRVAEAGEVARG